MQTPSRILTLAFTALLGFGASAASAQYAGPDESSGGRTPLRTVAEVNKNSRDDQPVRLSGNLVKKLAKEKYLFRDSTGEIRVEIDDSDFPATLTIDDKTRVELIGEVDKGFGRKTEIDVKRLRVPGEAW